MVATDEEYRWCQDMGESVARRGLLLLAAALALTAGTCAVPVAWGQPPDPTPELPPLEDLELFPLTPGETAEQLERHDRHADWLRRRAEFSLGTEDRERFAAWQEDVASRRRLWELLAKARDAGRVWQEETRREALASLRFRLGDAAYYTGRMPAPLPPGLPRRPPAVTVADVR